MQRAAIHAPIFSVSSSPSFTAQNLFLLESSRRLEASAKRSLPWENNRPRWEAGRPYVAKGGKDKDQLETTLLLINIKMYALADVRDHHVTLIRPLIFLATADKCRWQMFVAG